MTMIDRDAGLEVEVEIPADEVHDDKGKAAPVEAGTPEKADATKVTDDENVAELKAQLERHKRAAQDAELARAEEASQYRAHVQAIEEHAAGGTLGRVEAGIELEKTRIAEAKRVLKEAGELQDWGRFADAQTALGESQIRLASYEGYAQQLRASMKRNPTGGRVHPAAPRQEQADTVETFARQLKPNSAAWIRAHPELVTDDEMRHDMVAGHYKALKAGLAEDSPEYIAYLDERMGFSRPAGAGADQGGGAKPSAAAPRRPPSATMVGKTAVPSSDRQPATYKLTAAQVAICEQMGWDKKTYAKNAYAIEQEKKARKG